jgi:toxin ParE1/3/4
MNDLELLPERGHYPPELLRTGVRAFREVHFKPYRIIYTLQDQLIVVHCVLDGLRDFQSLLQERLLR